MCGFLRIIFRPKRDEVIGEWRKLHNEELNVLYCSPNIVRVIKSKIQWTGHVACIGKRRDVYGILVAKYEGKRDPGIDGRIILRRIFRKWDVEGLDWFEVAQDGDRWWALVNALTNLRGCITCGEFLA